MQTLPQRIFGCRNQKQIKGYKQYQAGSAVYQSRFRSNCPVGREGSRYGIQLSGRGLLAGPIAGMELGAVAP